MCGINGIFNTDKTNLINKNDLQLMNSKIVQRGPDEEGFYVKKNIGLGHQRLSIIDLENGQQPFSSPDQRYHLVYNGEIYNYKELTKELSEFEFRTNCDTEVVLYSFVKWGVNCFDKFNGMWSLAIYDTEKNELVLSRDRYGIKPLFYSIKGQTIFFASEIKSILAVSNKGINWIELKDHLFYGPKNGGKTMYNGINELFPGNYLRLNDSLVVEENYYSILNTYDNNSRIDLDYIEFLLIDSIEKRLISEVSIGTLNSGGLDSSIISAIAQSKLNSELSTFNVAPQNLLNSIDVSDESSYAQLLADFIGSKHTTIRYSQDDIFYELEKTIIYNDELLFHPNTVPLNILFNSIKNDYNITVVLGGEGADEIFCGYNTSKLVDFYKKFKFFPGIENFLKKRYLKNIELEKFSFPLQLAIVHNSQISPASYCKIFDENPPEMSEDRINQLEKIAELSPIHQFLAYEQQFYLKGLLTRLDRVSMLNSIEARVPFLDFRMVNYLNGIAFQKKTGMLNFQVKKILKNISKKYIPEEIINRKKVGFSAPISNYQSKISNELLKTFNENQISGLSSSEKFLLMNYKILLKQ